MQSKPSIDLLQALLSLLATITTAFVTWFIAHRQLSREQHKEITEASNQLEQEYLRQTTEIRKELRVEIDGLKLQIRNLEDKIGVLSTENINLRGEKQLLIIENASLKRENHRLRNRGEDDSEEGAS